MAAPFDPFASFVPVEVDPSTLRWPWDPEPAPTPDPTAAAQAAPVEPAIEVPAPIPLPPPIETLPSLQPPPEPVPAPVPLPPTDTGALLPGLGIPAAAAEGAVAGEQRYGEAAKALGESPFDEATGDVRADVSDADLERYLRDPKRRAKYATKLEELNTNRLLNEQTRILEEDTKARQANFKMNEDALKAAQARSAAIDADAARINATKLEPKDMGIAGVLMGIIGGLIQGRTGSARNMGIDALNDVINRKLEIDKANLANQREGVAMRRSALANEMALHGDMYRAQEAVRLAKLEEAKQQLAIERQKYAQRGTTALKAAALEAAIDVAIAGNKQKRDRELKEDEAKKRKQDLDEAQQRETKRHNQAGEYLEGRRIDSAAADRDLQRDLRRDEKATERADKEAERERQFSISSPRPTLMLDEKGQPLKGPDGRPVTTTNKLVNRNNKPWLLGDSESTRAMKDKVVAASEIADMIDEVLDIRDKVGGESSLWNSDARQRLKVLQSRMALVRKQGTQGMSSDKDFENLAASIGADDLTSFRARAAGLKEARERTISELNTQMRTANYDGPAIDFPNKYTSATNTPEDDRRKKLLINQGQSVDDAIKANLDKAAADRGYALDINDPADQELYQRITAETRAAYAPGATQEQAADIANLGRAAAAGDAASRAVLDELAAKAGSSRLRELAKAEIEALTPKPTPRGPTSQAPAVPDELRLR